MSVRLQDLRDLLHDTWADLKARWLAAKLGGNAQKLYWMKSHDLGMASASLFLEEDLVNSLSSPDPWRIKGEKLLRQKQFVEANRCFDRALRLTPSDANILNNKGYCLDQLEYHDLAYSCFRQALNLRPRDPEILVNTGVCLCNMGHYQEALKCFEKSLRNGGGIEGRNNQGFCLAKLGRFEEACAAYKIALEQSGFGQADLLCNLAVTLVYLGAYEEALSFFDRALRLAPDDPLLLNNVAVCLEKRGRYDLALKCYEQSLKYDANNPTYLCNKGVCLARMKFWDKALHCLHEVVKQDERNYPAYGELAAIYLAKGRAEDALNYYNKALGLT